MNSFYGNCFSHRIDILEVVTYRSNLLDVKFIFSRDSELKPRDWILLLDCIVLYVTRGRHFKFFVLLLAQAAF